jgi:hypothetical protein
VSERRRERKLPAVSTLVPLKEKSADVLVSVSLALSPMNTRESALSIGSPFRKLVFTPLSSGPARVTVGESPRPEASPMSAPLSPGAAPNPANADPPVR